MILMGSMARYLNKEEIEWSRFFYNNISTQFEYNAAE